MPSHLPYALAWMTLAAAVLGLGWLQRNTPTTERRFRRGLAIGCAAAWLYTQTYFIFREFNAYESLPIHICDLAGLLAPAMLLSNRRPLRTVLYFWGLGLTTQAFMTPVNDAGPGHPEFWAFWGSHTAILTAALYDFIIRQYRPTTGDLGFAVGLSLIYLALVFPLDAATGWNYGYVGPTEPDQPTLIDALGQWPLRVVWIALIVMALFSILWLIGRSIPTHSPKA